jgi:hypothetical protein
MTLDFAAADHVKQLRRAGLRPNERLAQNIVSSGEVAVGPLLALACDTALLEEPEPESFAPIHAMRLLGEIRSPRMIEPLVEAFRVERGHHHQSHDLWRTEMPQIIGRLGAAAVEPLWTIADDAARPMDQRGVAILALACTVAADETLREQVVAALRERFAASQDKSLTGHLIAALANLGDAEVYKESIARFRAGEVDLDVVSAAEARQLMLTPGIKRLACTNHPLWERYDHHGPFADRD